MASNWAWLFILAAGVSAQTNVLISGDGSISGTVRDATNGSPKAGVKVMIAAGAASRTSTAGSWVAADDTGHYHFEGLGPGLYQIRAEGPTVTLSEGDTELSGTAAGQIKTLNLKAGEQLQNVDLRIRGEATISGFVVDENFNPIPGILVSMLQKDYEFGMLLHHRVGFSATTGADGAFHLRLVPVEQELLVMASEARKKSGAGGGSGGTMFLPTFFPSSNMVETAVAVTVQPGEHRQGVQIRMMRGGRYCADGVVRTEEQRGNLQISLRRIEISPRLREFEANSSTELPANGAFRFCDLTDGEYRLAVTNESLYGAGSITIRKDNVRDIQLDVPK